MLYKNYELKTLAPNHVEVYEDKTQIGTISLGDKGYTLHPLPYFWGGEETQAQFKTFQAESQTKEFLDAFKQEVLKTRL